MFNSDEKAMNVAFNMMRERYNTFKMNDTILICENMIAEIRKCFTNIQDFDKLLDGTLSEHDFV